MHIEDLLAFATLASLILYALMGGADFGGGFWDLFASGPRAGRQRAAIAEAIGPIWEANHVWLILVVVLLFTAWPSAFAALMTALHIPLTAMLLGIVLRGTSFVFRKYDTTRDTVQRRWSRIFGVSSVFTPFVQGMILGALTTGRIRIEGGALRSGFFAGWLTPFALGCGAFALLLFAFLAATYLTVDTESDPAVQHDFRIRAILAELALAPAAGLVFVTSRAGAPEMYRGLTNWWAPFLLAWTTLTALTALWALWRQHYRLARAAAIGQVATILLGWCLAQYPHLVFPDLTIRNTAAPESTLRLLTIALGLGIILLLPALYYLFHVFKGARTSSSAEAQDRDRGGGVSR